MSLDYEELDFTPTSMGDLMLRRRRTPLLNDLDIYEVKLGDYFLMSSLFHEAERQLAILGLQAVKGESLNVVVGGLGLGYTAVAALEDQRVSSLTVVEYLAPVIDWHQRGLVPMGPVLTSDPRCVLREADFFALSKETENSFCEESPTLLHDAILLDIDHTPTNVLRQTNTRFYTEEGLAELRSHLRKGGIFGLWADLEPEPHFTEHLQKVFDSAEAHRIEFPNTLTGGNSCGTVYLAQA